MPCLAKSASGEVVQAADDERYLLLVARSKGGGTQELARTRVAGRSLARSYPWSRSALAGPCPSRLPAQSPPSLQAMDDTHDDKHLAHRTLPEIDDNDSVIDKTDHDVDAINLSVSPPLLRPLLRF